jgi:outer membrane immunogenic protein
MPRTIRLGLAIVALIGAATGYGARADDRPIVPTAGLAVAAPYNLTGFYAGVNAGGSWGRSNTDAVLDHSSHGAIVDTAIGSMSQPGSGGLAGVQAGYNFQTNALVFGLEGDVQRTSWKGDALLSDTVATPQVCAAPCAPPPPIVTTGTLHDAQSLPWFGTLRGRVGVTPTERWLVYATGGLGFGEIRTDATFTVPAGAACVAPCAPPAAGLGAGSSRQIKAGWVVGAGVEAALGGGWTGKLEYLHLDLGGVDNALAFSTPPFRGTIRTSSRFADEIVRVGLNYRFGDPIGVKY